MVRPAPPVRTGAQRHGQQLGMPKLPQTPRPAPVADHTPGAPLDEGVLRQVLGYQLAQAAVVTAQTFRTAMAGMPGLRHLEYTLLALVQHNPGVTAAQLAQALSVTPPNLASYMDSLVKRGLVARAADARDRRALQIRLTDDGHQLLAQASRAILAAEAQAAAAVLSPAERLMLGELLHKLARARGEQDLPAA